MNTTIFKEWFETIFIPEIRDYLQQQGLPFKALLVIDNAPVHSKLVNENFPNVQVLFLPPNTTSLCQPMDQSVIRSWKGNYSRFLMEEIIDRSEENETIEKSMKDFDLFSAMKIMDRAWSAVRPETVAKSFNKIWIPEENENEFSENNENDYLNLLKTRFSSSEIDEILAEPEEDIIDLWSISEEEKKLILENCENSDENLGENSDDNLNDNSDENLDENLGENLREILDENLDENLDANRGDNSGDSNNLDTHTNYEIIWAAEMAQINKSILNLQQIFNNITNKS